MSSETLTRKTTINLVSDLGEGFGPYKAGDDAAMLDIVSSANVACGFHAGDPVTMENMVRMCAEKGVAVGAHPGFDDRRNFGRVRIEMPQEQLYADTLYQLGALKAFTDKYGVPMTHVGVHGRLGNLVGEEEYYAEPVFRAIHDFDPTIRSGGGGVIGKMLADAGHPSSRGGLPDRNYEPDGRLVRRTHPEALVHDADQVVERAVRLILEGVLIAIDGVTEIPIDCDTILLHGDKPEAVETAKKLKARLDELGIEIKALEEGK